MKGYEPISAKTLARIDHHREAGEYWRAREILQANVGASAYDPIHLLALGELCLVMGDLPAAGRFLLLATERRSEHDAALELFRSRMRRAGPQDLVRALPRPARLRLLRDYPESVAAELDALGVTDEHLKISRRKIEPIEHVHEFSRPLRILGWIGVMYLIAAFLVGLVYIPLALWDMFFGS